MALKRVTNLPTGFKIAYWRVAPVTINYDAREVHFTIAGYKNEETRRTSNAPADYREIRMKGAEFDQFFLTNEPLRTQCYKAAIAKDPFFKEATAD